MPGRAIELRRSLGALTSFLLLAGVIALFFEYKQHAVALHARPIVVSIERLPYYSFCSFYRMLAAYIVALIFSIVYGMLAAQSRAYERVLIPVVDIAQSVPVVGFFPAAIFFFVRFAHGRLGVELAAIFLIFTSQAWNMTLGVFEAVRTIPGDSNEALEAFGARGFLRFRRLLLPACIPKLVYNSILSWVAGWYYLTACEIITAGQSNYRLPGLGSLLMEAMDKGRWGEMIAGLGALLLIIVAMDVVVWQPLSVWAEKFRYEFAATGAVEPIASFAMLRLLGGIGPTMMRALQFTLRPIARPLFRALESVPRLDAGENPGLKRIAGVARIAVLVAIVVFFTYAMIEGLAALVRTLLQPWPPEAKRIPAATLASLIRITIAYALSVGWTLPCALLAGESPRFNRWLTSIAEIAGSMPATALFPLIVLFVIKVTGGMNLGSVLLVLTGMQWYVLFNLLAGVNQIPSDLKEATRSFGLSRFETWRRLTIPALVPSLVTGSITAWGGGWNALILSEYVQFRGRYHEVLGLGALLDEATYQTGNNVMILISLLSMIAVVIGLNRLVWRRVYDVATERYRLDY